MNTLKLIQYKIENDLVKEEEEKRLELRKKDLYKIDYTVPAFIASPADKYMERRGNFGHDIERLSKNMDEILLELGKSVTEKLDPIVQDGVIGRLYWNKSYRLLNCIVEQKVQSVNTHINGQRYELFYKFSIMGHERPVNDVVLMLQGEYWNPDPFTNNLVKPDIKRYENMQDLRPNNFKSIEKLEKKLKLIATMGYKSKNKTDWKWVK
jgi:hypothetical protein